MENSCREKYKPSPKKWILASSYPEFRRNSALIPANAGLFHYAGNNPVRYIDPDGNDFKSVATAFKDGAVDGLIEDAKGIYNFGKNLVNDPEQTLGDVYASIKNEASLIVSNPSGYALDKYEDIKQFAGDFADGSWEERAYTLGGTAEKIGVTALAAKGLGKVNGTGKITYYRAKSIRIGSPTGMCFVAGTLVSSENGLIPIEEIKEGNYVYAYNEDTDKIELQAVIKTFVREVDEVLVIKLADAEIVTTSEHPFWVKEKGWVIASELQNDYSLWTKENEFITVLSVEIKTLDTPVLVYNFEVENAHSYFVGEEKVLVHNSCAQGVSKFKQFYKSINDAPTYPKGFQAVKGGIKKVPINNPKVSEGLRGIESGKWMKVYKNGYDASGNKISIHFFQSESGKVFNVKVKDAWSTW